MEIILAGVGVVSFSPGAGVKMLIDWQKSRKPGILSMGQARTIGLAYAEPEIKDIFTITNKNKRAKKAQLLLAEHYVAKEKYASKLKENEKTAEKIRQELSLQLTKREERVLKSCKKTSWLVRDIVRFNVFENRQSQFQLALTCFKISTTKLVG